MQTLPRVRKPAPMTARRELPPRRWRSQRIATRELEHEPATEAPNLGRDHAQTNTSRRDDVSKHHLARETRAAEKRLRRAVATAEPTLEPSPSRQSFVAPSSSYASRHHGRKERAGSARSTPTNLIPAKAEPASSVVRAPSPLPTVPEAAANPSPAPSAPLPASPSPKIETRPAKPEMPTDAGFD
jgi:hypothetical protein